MSRRARDRTHPRLQHHFDNLEQQLEASTLGMWVFLVTEVLFFGGLFTRLHGLPDRGTPTRSPRPATTSTSSLGGVNTVVLIGSSLTMALAVCVRAARASAAAQMLFLVLTMVLGAAFLGIKAVEYSHKFEHHLVPGPHFQFERPATRCTRSCSSRSTSR